MLLNFVFYTSQCFTITIWLSSSGHCPDDCPNDGNQMVTETLAKHTLKNVRDKIHIEIPSQTGLYRMLQSIELHLFPV